MRLIAARTGANDPGELTPAAPQNSATSPPQPQAHRRTDHARSRGADGGHLFDPLDICLRARPLQPEGHEGLLHRTTRQHQQAASPPICSAKRAYLPARRCQRVRLSIFLCFFLRIRFRRFFIRLPMTVDDPTRPFNILPNCERIASADRHPTPPRSAPRTSAPGCSIPDVLALERPSPRGPLPGLGDYYCSRSGLVALAHRSWCRGNAACLLIN